MIEKLKTIFSRLKNGKIILILGIMGVLLISLSGLFSSEEKTPVIPDKFDTNAYKELLEDDIRKLVKDITSYRSVTVVVTLDSGIKYNYADETQKSDSNRHSDTASESSSNSEQNRVIITDQDGNENALIVNEELPQIRGVAVVYDGPNNEFINEKIKNALMATLSVTSKRIYISGKGGT